MLKIRDRAFSIWDVVKFNLLRPQRKDGVFEVEEIKMLFNEEMFLECYEIICASSKEIRPLKLIKYSALLFTLFILSKLYVEFTATGKINPIGASLLIVCIILLWFLIYGYKLLFRRQGKELLKSKEFPTEYTITFDETGIKGSSVNSMAKNKWEEIRSVCENENYWVFGDGMYFIDKRILTKEQFLFLKKKSDMIKLQKQ